MKRAMPLPMADVDTGPPGLRSLGKSFSRDLCIMSDSGDFVMELTANAGRQRKTGVCFGRAIALASDVGGTPAVNGAVAIIFPAAR